MQMKNFFVFLMAVALALPLATAFNCTALDGENKKVCNYIESQPWSQSEKDSVIQEAIDSGSSLNGNFDSIMNKQVPEIQLNKIEEVEPISEENKEVLIDISSIFLFFYVVYAFLKRYYLLWRFL
jgi:hypothetical protein